jgi:hypothetical protein
MLDTEAGEDPIAARFSTPFDGPSTQFWAFASFAANKDIANAAIAAARLTPLRRPMPASLLPALTND